MKRKIRIFYAFLFAVLMLTEIYIAAFVTNVFVRSYLGDVFITLLICFFIQAVIPKKITLLPIWVFLFALAVEIGQYFDVVKLLGLENYKLISVWFGRSFSFYDIICYGVGCLIFAVVNFFILRRLEKSK